MYRVLLADDEPSALESMQKYIAWEQHHMEVTKVTGNGNDAYDYLLSDTPDIAVLDIRMPGLSGLELSKFIFQKKLKTKVIIVSGYAEFSYAQRAIQYGVIGYCLKPVEYEELTSLLIKAVRTLQTQNQHLSDHDFLDALEANAQADIIQYLDSNSFLKEQYYLASSSSEAPLPLPDCLTFCIGSGQYGYLSARPLDTDTLTELSTRDEVRCIGVYPEAVSLGQLRSAFYRCLAMGYHYFIEPDCKFCNHYHEFYSLPHMLDLQNAVNFSQRDKVIDLLRQQITSESSKCFSIHSAQQLYNLVLSNSRFISNSQDYYIYHYKQLAHEYESFQAMLEHLIVMLSGNTASSDSHEDISNSYFLKIMKYISTCYHDNISLADVAAVVNLSPNYISQVFKKATGSTFSHYLTNLRIDHAKKLLSTTDISINDISLQAGFNDYFYFLKTFKKYTGKTPSEYRNFM